MAVPPPRDPWHRRGWGYINRPYAGFGCLWIMMTFITIYLIISLLFTSIWLF